MFRLLFAIFGFAFFGALFAGIYYAPENVERQTQSPFNLGPGEVRVDFMEPSIEGGTVTINLTIAGGSIDLWVMDQEWVETVLDRGEGRLNLSRPFNHHSQWSMQNLTGQHNLTFTADGQTRLGLVLDHSDAYYSDTAPGEDPVAVQVQTRYLEEETKSLVWGYMAATPSLVLVLLTLGRKYRRWSLHRRDRP